MYVVATIVLAPGAMAYCSLLLNMTRSSAVFPLFYDLSVVCAMELIYALAVTTFLIVAKVIFIIIVVGNVSKKTTSAMYVAGWIVRMAVTAFVLAVYSTMT